MKKISLSTSINNSTYKITESLKSASFSGRLDTVKQSVEQNANIHADNDIVLRWASCYGYTEIVKCLRRILSLEEEYLSRVNEE
jgi:hypothetical protein